LIQNLATRNAAGAKSVQMEGNRLEASRKPERAKARRRE
jgi:hypothetical protein